MRSPFLRRFGMPSPFFDNETGFSPAALFALAEPGIWLDPSDVANLDWRRNLLTYTEQFDNAAWTKVGSTITVNATTAPDGTTTADKIVEDALTSSHGINPATFTFAATTAYTASIYVKAAERSWVYMQFASAPFVPNTRAWFNLSDGTTSQVQNSTVTITSVGNGWYRCTLTATSAAGGVSTTPLVVGASTGSGVSSYAGDGTSGVFMWGAQLEIGSVATTYQPITDVNTEVLQRFPTTTMFVDRAGTTAVTTPGQSVGLRLDKSKGLVLGSELVTNGTFDSGAGWALADSATISGGLLTLAAVNASRATQTSVPVVVGRTYAASFTVLSNPSGTNVRLDDDGGGSVQVFRQATTTGTFTAIFRALTSTIRVINTNGIGAATIDNISVKELPGNHAVATADLNRGIYGIEPLGGTRNLLTYTEQFDNAAWVLFNVSGSASRTGSTITFGANATDRLTQSGRTIQSGAHTVSVILSGTGEVRLYLLGGDGSTGAPNTITLTGTPTRYTLTRSPAAGGSFGGIGIYNNAAGTPATVTLSEPQLETGSTATAYQRVVDQYNVTEAGVPTLHYVQYDGSNDTYLTPTITPGTDKVQVFTGIRKLSDATRAVFMEWSTTSANNGTFAVEAPAVAAEPRFTFFSRGTLAVSPGVNNAIYAAPNTRVLTGLADISGDVATMRLNGTQVNQSTGDQGTGNYLAYPLYIGRRNDASFPFNGRDYGIIVRFGANLTATQIADTEGWMNQRTGAY